MLRSKNPAALVTLIGVVATLVAVRAEAKKVKCFPREGHCVAVVVNGQPTVALTKTTKKLLKSLDEVSHYVSDTRYEVPEPISGELDVVASMVKGAEASLGAGGTADVQIVPLQEVEIATQSRLVAEPSVRVEGNAAVGVGRFMQDNRLPPGQYLLRANLKGPNNWDRQTVFFTVQE